MQTQMQDREVSKPDLFRHTYNYRQSPECKHGSSTVAFVFEGGGNQKVMEPSSASQVSKFSLMFLEAEVPLQAVRK